MNKSGRRPAHTKGLDASELREARRKRAQFLMDRGYTTRDLVKLEGISEAGYYRHVLYHYPNIREGLLGNGIDQTIKYARPVKLLRLALYYACLADRCSNITAANILGYGDVSNWYRAKARLKLNIDEEIDALFDEREDFLDWRATVMTGFEFILSKDREGFYRCKPMKSRNTYYGWFGETVVPMVWKECRNGKQQGQRPDPRGLNLPTEFGLPKIEKR